MVEQMALSQIQFNGGIFNGDTGNHCRSTLTMVLSQIWLKRQSLMADLYGDTGKSLSAQNFKC